MSPDFSDPEREQLPSQWLDRMRQGDVAARDELLRHSVSRFERMARRMLRDFPAVRRWEQTGDVLQNAMIRLLRALEQTEVRSAGHFLALAATQMRRELIDLTRRYRGPLSAAANHASWSPDESHRESPAVPDAADATHEPGGLAQWCELHEQIAQLDEADRAVCELLWYQGLTQREAAELLDVSERTVKRRWQSVRLRLHAWLVRDD